jgi:hypothetical protein
MLFTEPCCKVLRQCLEPGHDHTFHRVGGKVGPLMVRIGTSVYEVRGVLQSQILEQAVIYCPFCGKHLQTAEDVERYMRGELQ